MDREEGERIGVGWGGAVEAEGRGILEVVLWKGGIVEDTVVWDWKCYCRGQTPEKDSRDWSEHCWAG